MLLAGGTGSLAQEGYRLEPDQVKVEQEHWQKWEAATGSYVITEDGTLQPRFLRRGINAVLDAGEFETAVAGRGKVTGGIRQAGSQPKTAAQVMDGDPATWWEPDPEDGLGKWFVEIDLGRAVIAQQVVVRFAEEGAGDPFLKFRVLLSDGRTVAGSQDRFLFYRAGQVVAPNKDQRIFRFEVQPQRPVPPGVSGEVAQVVRFEALDTNGPRGFEVSAQEYDNLPLADRGAVEYFRQTLSGRYIRIDQEAYETLPAAEKGPIRYFRHERPRLAELEVHALGDNVVNLTQRLRNRDMALFDNIVLSLSTDGLYSSFYPLRVYDPVQHKNQLEIDLGAKFWLDRIRLLMPESPITAYQLRVSDGALGPSGAQVWHSFEERQNRESFRQLEERFPLREVRFIELRRLELIGAQQEEGNLSEVQAYGEGFVSEVVLVSPLIRLGRARMFTDLSWEGEALQDSRLEIRTRSGDDLTRIEQYFDVFGRQISKEQWNAISQSNRGAIIVEELPGPKWSNWSELYQRPGEAFKSPSPRTMAQVQVRMTTTNPLRGAALRSLRIGLAPPLVAQLLAEVWPVERVFPGKQQEFTLYLQPVFAPGDPGFDRLRLRSSSSVPIELLSLRAGQDAELRAGAGQQLWPGPVQLETLEDGGVELRFPAPLLSGQRVYSATFRTQVFLSNTTFSAELLNSSQPGVVQGATEGDASSAIQSESLVVIADLQKAPLLGAFAVVPGIFSPNGDGVNDQAQIQFSIYQIRGERLLSLGVYDLTGRQVRDLSVVRENPSGLHTIPWDGCDQAGQRVLPGIYLVRLGFSTQSHAGGTEQVRLVHVVY